ncbi:MAG: type Z 30S ribosomal protein S14 [Chloroflexota bacterium]
MAKKSEIAKWARPARYKAQQHNRCHLCGRPRAYLRDFALCRICFRKLALAGEIPGVRKSSW